MAWRDLTRQAAIWKAAWADESGNLVRTGAAGGAVEFLPAALEIQEAPPSPIGRAITWTIIAVFVSAVLWSVVSRLDMVAVAQGKIIPSGYSKVIQPLEGGVIAAIHVRDGQPVKRGDLLIELDTTVTGAEQDRLVNERNAARVEALRLRALLAGAEAFVPPPDVNPELTALQQQLLLDQLTEFRAKVDSARHLIDQRKAALEATKEDVARLQATVPIETERAAMYRKLLADQFVSKMDYLQFEQQRIDRTRELAGQRQKLVQDRAALAEAEENYRVLLSEFQRTRQAELSDTETKAASLEQEVIKAGQKTDFQTLLSPIDGVVQQLAVHTVGGVVTPAQQLMVIVPEESPIEVEAWIENKDIGFVHAGQPVQIKVDTFPFTIYGVIDGTVLTVSSDAIPQEKAGLVYEARVSMARSTMQVEQKQVHLTPGMAVSVEIKTGTRRAIEYFLSPLLKGLHESIRER
ncbi:HlyD family type I secretion periplasmic adaptor subunit [Candidatus Nitrospira bockiana]